MKKRIGLFIIVNMIVLSLLAGNVSSVFAEGSDNPEVPAEVAEASQPEKIADEVEVFQDNANTEKYDLSTNEIPENLVLGGNAQLTGGSLDQSGDGWLSLTTDTKLQEGYALFNQPLQTDNGLAFQFDFTSWGKNGTGGDGISFFLIDGETQLDEFKIGGSGGSLGYSPRYKATEGLSNAYIGIGLDEFGNFSNPTEGRNGGTGRAQDEVTVRGSGDGFDGYEFIAGTGKLAEGIDIPSSKQLPDQSGSKYRNVSIIFQPVKDQFSLTLKMQFGVANEPKELFSNLLIPGIVPSSVLFGFIGITSSATSNHEIRNVIVDKAVIEKAEIPIVEPTISPIQTEVPITEIPIQVVEPQPQIIIEPVVIKHDSDNTNVIPVTGAKSIELNCKTTTKLEILDQAYVFLPAFCQHKAILNQVAFESLPGKLPEIYHYINSVNLNIISNSNADSNNGNMRLELGFIMNKLSNKDNFAILFWDQNINSGSGAWVKLDSQSQGKIVTVNIQNTGLFVLVQKLIQ